MPVDSISTGIFIFKTSFQKGRSFLFEPGFELLFNQRQKGFVRAFQPVAVVDAEIGGG